MNNKTVVAVLVLILVALAGVGVGKYAHNYNMKQEAASVKSQKVVPTDAKVKATTVPVAAGGPKGTVSFTPPTAVCLNYIQGATPAAGTLHTGGNIIGTFGLKNVCSYDVTIQQIKTVAQGSVDIRLDMDPSNTYAYDSTNNYPLVLNPSASTYIGTFIQYAFDASTLTLTPGQVHDFEVRATVQGNPPTGTPLQTYTTNVQAVDPSGIAVGTTGLTGNLQNYSF